MRIDFKTLIDNPLAGSKMHSASFNRYKGGGGSVKRKLPELTGMGKTAQGILYRDYGKAIDGKGYTPSNVGTIKKYINEGYDVGGKNLEDYMNLSLDPNDTKVRGFLRDSMKSAKANNMLNVDNAEIQRLFDEQQLGVSKGLDAIAGEKRMAMDVASQYNQVNQQLKNTPSFASALGEGLGAGAAWMAPVMFGKGMSNQSMASSIYTKPSSFGGSWQSTPMMQTNSMTGFTPKI